MAKTKSKTGTISYEDNQLFSQLCGPRNAHLNKLENFLDITLAVKGNKLKLDGAPADINIALNILDALWHKLENGGDILMTDVETALRFALNEEGSPSENPAGVAPIKTKKKPITPRSPNQVLYIDTIREHEMTFGLGPAGTGKTYLAVALGVEMFLKGGVERLIFTRPAVEAGEKIGFLPGDMKEKVDPYLRPIYDALHDMMPLDLVEKKMVLGDIEIAPLAFMRGRTLAHSFVILDEAQNTTSAQMKMFLTRMGEGSRMVVTGDPTQSDLPPSQASGLNEALVFLKDLKEIGVINFTGDDVVRHHLVAKIIHAYDSRRT